MRFVLPPGVASIGDEYRGNPELALGVYELLERLHGVRDYFPTSDNDSVNVEQETKVGHDDNLLA